MMYAVARLHSMEEKAKSEGILVGAYADGSKLPEPEAYDIASVLMKFPSVLQKTAADLEPCNICNYALDLAKAISRAYVKLRVLGEADRDVAAARLALYVAARTVLTQALKILGLRQLTRM
jgi:arginyl-tRNA synthetase